MQIGTLGFGLTVSRQAMEVYLKRYGVPKTTIDELFEIDLRAQNDGERASNILKYEKMIK